MVDKLFDFFVNNVSDGGNVVGGVAGAFAGKLVLHAILMFGCHVGAEEKIGFTCWWLGSPYFESIVEKTGTVDVFVAKTEELGIRDGFIAIGGKFLALAELKKRSLIGVGGFHWDVMRV